MITGKVLGDTYVINGLGADTKDFTPDMSAHIYYEVIRVVNGKACFLEDHLQRLEQSIKGSSYVYPDKEVIVESLKKVILNNPITDGNLRISLQCGEDIIPTLLCYYVPHLYPEKQMYLEGVDLLSYPHERSDPGIKKWDDNFRKAVWLFIREKEIYEVLLLNRDGFLTEGSRSNVFFLDPENRLITPPGRAVLAGVTRDHVIRIAEAMGLRIEEDFVHKDQLGNFTSCFITGTSPKVLPVRKLDHHGFRADHPILKKLMSKYDSIIQKNLSTFA